MIESLIFFIINSVIVLVITSKSYIIAKKFNFLDYPSKNKIHTHTIESMRVSRKLKPNTKKRTSPWHCELFC